jgi:hypothetical protein
MFVYSIPFRLICIMSRNVNRTKSATSWETKLNWVADTDAGAKIPAVGHSRQNFFNNVERRRMESGREIC